MAIGLALFAANSLAVLGGWLWAPPAFVPAFSVRGSDFAQYYTWIEGFRSAWVIPNYHAPWPTDAGFFSPIPFLIARLANISGLDPVIWLHAVHAAAYVAAAAALLWLVAICSATANERRAAWIAFLLAVPAKSLAMLPVMEWARQQGGVYSPPGMQAYLFWTSDGFLHGVSGSPLQTIGTALTIAAFAALGSFLLTGRRRYLVMAVTAVFTLAFAHPFEMVVVCTAGATTLLWLRRTDTRRAIIAIVALGTGALVGLTPTLVAVQNTPWLQTATRLNRWNPPWPPELLLMLGLPTIVALALIARRLGTPRDTDVLLKIWTLTAVVAVYVPGMPWSQHMLDGVLYGSAILAARHACDLWPQFASTDGRQKTLTVAAVALVALSLVPAVYLRWISLVDGGSATPRFLFSAVKPADEAATLAWLRKHARPDELVFAPPEQATWFATVPMRSFASHHLFSLTYTQQRTEATTFYRGMLSAEKGMALLRHYEVRWLVVRSHSPAKRYVIGLQPAAVIGGLEIYDLTTAGS